MWHIADLKAYDHILFLVVLFGGYELKDWRKVLILITSFTFGHSITLIMSVLEVVKVNVPVVEFLIPCTILITALYNLITLGSRKKKSLWLNFSMALLFGLIHGLGFSVLLKSLLGSMLNATWPLIAFNLGIEAGQLLIISVIFILTLIAIKLVKIKSETWSFFLSSAAFGIALIMALERI